MPESVALCFSFLYASVALPFPAQATTFATATKKCNSARCLQAREAYAKNGAHIMRTGPSVLPTPDCRLPPIRAFSRFVMCGSGGFRKDSLQDAAAGHSILELSGNCWLVNNKRALPLLLAF